VIKSLCIIEQKGNFLFLVPIFTIRYWITKSDLNDVLWRYSKPICQFWSQISKFSCQKKRKIFMKIDVFNEKLRFFPFLKIITRTYWKLKSASSKNLKADLPNHTLKSTSWPANKKPILYRKHRTQNVHFWIFYIRITRFQNNKKHEVL